MKRLRRPKPLTRRIASAPSMPWFKTAVAWGGFISAIFGVVRLTTLATRGAVHVQRAHRTRRQRRQQLGDAEPGLPAGFRDMAEVHTLMRLAATPKGKMVPKSATRLIATEALPKPANYSEEEMFAHRGDVYRAMTKPPKVPRFPVGTFRYDDFFPSLPPEVDELREYDLNDPRIRFPEGYPPGWNRGRNEGVRKYVEWIRAGSEPPPVDATEHETGTVSVSEGHHRRAALQRAGRRKIKAWVALTHLYPAPRWDGSTMWIGRGVTHSQAKELISDLAKTRRKA